MAVDSPELPFRFERKLTLAAGNGPLRIQYRVLNKSRRELPYLWAAHPLISIKPGDTICLPEGTVINSTCVVGVDPEENCFPLPWPELKLRHGRSLDLSYIPPQSAGYALKLFAENIASKSIQIASPDEQDGLKFYIPGEHAPHCGLWLNYGAWSGAQTGPYYNIGIEPTTAPYDDLSTAWQHGRAQTLKSETEHEWQLEITS
jgi:hypothetical protein